ncbi:MAG TPA: discoidin domain-containing protein, partial [Polyangiaceae bacterium]|nr:discoidin domain-containing protein [Polyangiaceae bacterium]
RGGASTVAWVGVALVLGVLALGVLGVALAVLKVWSYLDQRGDLAVGKEWRVSSSYGVGGCAPPEQECGQVGGGYFFHTAVDDSSPWVEFDLGSEMPVARVDVKNRTDCCFERAVPLGIELSRNRQAWQTVARRDEVFTSWRASFEPVKARYVRLRLMGTGTLHLSRVGIFR